MRTKTFGEICQAADLTLAWQMPLVPIMRKRKREREIERERVRVRKRERERETETETERQRETPYMGLRKRG